MHLHLANWLLLIAAATTVAAGVLYYLRNRNKKSEAEKERERRLAVNAVGRMTDGTLTEAVDPHTDAPGDSRTGLLIFYRYSVSGVEYSAAQEIIDLRHVVRARTYYPGEAVTIKYDSQNPTNSIVVCEEWNGLRDGAEFLPKPPKSSLSRHGVR